MLIGFQWSFHCLWHFTYVIWGLKTLIGFLISVESRWPVLSKCNIMLLNLVTCLRSPFDFSNLAQVSSTFYFYFFYAVICFGGYLLHGFTVLCILYLCVFYSYACGCWIFFFFWFPVIAITMYFKQTDKQPQYNSAHSYYPNDKKTDLWEWFCGLMLGAFSLIFAVFVITITRLKLRRLVHKQFFFF